MVQPEHRRLSYRFATALALALLALSACSSSKSPTPLADLDSATVAARVTEGPAIPLSTAGHVGGLVGGVPVVAGGSSWVENRTKKRWNHECFAYRDGQWMPAPSLPQPLADAAYAFGPRGLYTAGGTDGKGPTNAVLHLNDTSSGASWKRMTPLPATVEAASGAMAGDTFYVFGGFSGGKASSQLWALDVTKPDVTWRSLAPLPAPGRGYAAFAAAGDELYLFGGFTLPPYEPKPAVFRDAYRYDPAKDRWTKLEGFDLPGYGWTATAVGPTQIMLTGHVPEIAKVSDAILLVDLSTLNIRPIGHLLLPGCCMPAIPVAPRTWWLPGGEPDTNRSRSDRTMIVTLEDKDER